MNDAIRLRLITASLYSSGADWTAENLCAACGHPRASHLDQPLRKGQPPSSDRGWCTLPPGTCIHLPCDCKAFVEPECASEPNLSETMADLLRARLSKKELADLIALLGDERQTCSLFDELRNMHLPRPPRSEPSL